MKFTHALIHYDEISLKGKNRVRFETQLIDNIVQLETGRFFLRVQRIFGRLLGTLTGEIDVHEMSVAFEKLYGVTSVRCVTQCAADIDEITQIAVGHAKEISFSSFCVRAKRSNKLFSLTSQEINHRVGKAIEEVCNAAVNLENPEITFFIEIVDRNAYVGTLTMSGPGGLPVSVSGKVMLLISGGIDSPVAGAMLQKRGCPLVCVHFHNAPYTSEASIEKVRDLVKILAAAQGDVKLYLIPFTELQKEIVKKCGEQYRVILYRRFMMRVAEELCRRERIHALATGDSVGQVASQTVENLSVVSSVTSLPLFRPLIGFDKNEIIGRARQLGTYAISILPHEDCCSYFMPRNPATHATLEEIKKQEEFLDVHSLVKEVLSTMQCEILKCIAS